MFQALLGVLGNIWDVFGSIWVLGRLWYFRDYCFDLFFQMFIVVFLSLWVVLGCVLFGDYWAFFGSARDFMKVFGGICFEC